MAIWTNFLTACFNFVIYPNFLTYHKMGTLTAWIMCFFFFFFDSQDVQIRIRVLWSYPDFFFFLRIVSIRSISDWIWKSGCSLAIHSWKKTPENSETGRIFYLPDFTQLLIGLEFQGQDVSRGYVNFMKRSFSGAK